MLVTSLGRRALHREKEEEGQKRPLEEERRESAPSARPMEFAAMCHP